MTPKDPTIEPDPEPVAPGGDDEAARDVGRSGRRPPGPGALPISNLPPPTWTTRTDDDVDVSEVLDDEPADPAVDGSSGEPITDLVDGPPPELELEEPIEADDLVAADLADDVADQDPSEGLAEGDLYDRSAVHEEPALVDVGVDMDLDRVAERDDPGEPTGEGPTPVAAGAHGHPRRRVALVLLAVAALVYGVLKVQQANDLAGDRDDRNAVQEVSRAFGAAYLTYDYEHVERSARAVHHLSTEAFAEAYAAQSAPGIEQLFSSRQTITRAQTQEVFVGAVRRASARALVVVDVTATSPTDGEQRLDDVSFVLDLARTGDGWRVAKVARSPQATLAAPAAP